MSSIRSELNALITPENRSRSSISAGLFHIFIPFFLSCCAAILAEKLSTTLPSCEIIFKATALVFIGTRWRALGNIIHECSHGIFVKSARHNEILGHLISSFEFTDFKIYCKQHQTHHVFLGDPEYDLDFKARFEYLSDQGSNKRRLLKTMMKAITLIPLWARQARPVVWAKKNPLWTNILRIFLLITTFAGLLQEQTSSYIFLYAVLPFTTTYQWMRLFSDCADHIFLYGHKNEIDRSRNHIFSSRWLNKLLFPRNDAYHLVHHLFPTLPTHAYPDIHNKFMSHSWYARKRHNISVFFDSFWRIKLESQGQSR
ncbi:MAG: hypothetical protein RJB13_2292 [Pseudomonadota bacterium]